jgi:uncharacterized delta-60 repeat protein
MKKASLALLGLVVALAGCQTQPAPIQKHFLGFIDVQFSGSGTQAKATLKALGSNPQTRALTDIANGLDFKPLSNGAFDTGTRGADGKRYLWASFKVRNADQTGVPYTTSRNNVSFVAVSMPTTIDQTAISALKKFDGSAASTSIARSISPTHGMELDLAIRKASTRKNTEDLQFFTELEASALGAGFTGVDSVLPYGYVMRNIAASSRNLPANPSAGDYAGTVTFAVQMPLQATSADDPFYISLRLAVVEDSQTTVSKSLEETVSNAKTRATTLNAIENRSACSGVRIAGNTPAAVSNTVITDAPTSGQLDYCSFGQFGIQDVNSSPYQFKKMAVQSDGKILLLGDFYNSSNPENYKEDLVLRRFNANGSLDTTFGTNGTIVLNTGGGENGAALAVQSDNKIVIAGTRLESFGSNTIRKALVARLNTDGTLDTTFGGSSCPCAGYTSQTYNDTNVVGLLPYDSVNNILILPNDSVVVVGQAEDDNTRTYDAGIMQLTSNGVLDSSFNFDGKVQLNFSAGGNLDRAIAVVRNAAGQLIVAATSYDQSGNNNHKEGMIRYNPNGVVDLSFGSSNTGIVTIAAQANSKDLIQDSSGNLLYLTAFENGQNSDYRLLRFNSAGIADTTFANSGVYTLNVSGFGDTPVNVVQQTDGKILIVGYSEPNNGSVFGSPDKLVTTVRLSTTGALDSTYGVSGIQSTNVGGSDNVINAVLSNDKVLVYSFDNNSSYAISRFVP